MAPHSSVLAWRIPGMEEPGRLLSMGLHRVGHYQSDLVAAAAAPYYASILNQMMAQGLIWPTWSIKSMVQAQSIPWLFHVLAEGHRRKSHRKTGLQVTRASCQDATNSSWKATGETTAVEEMVPFSSPKSTSQLSFVMFHVGKRVGGGMQNLQRG